MSDSSPRMWLSREHQVHGPYDLAQLTEMDSQAELLPEDQFCSEHGEHWMTYEEWRASLRKRSVVKPSQRVLSHTERVTIDQKKRNVEMKSHIQPHPTLTRARLLHQPPPEDETPEHRLTRLTEMVSEHRRTQGHAHPFHYMDYTQVADVVVWLDYHHPLWDCRPLETINARRHIELLDKWLIPAIARLHPDLVKPSHKIEFGANRRWHLAS